jgi:hypothetical protein
VQNVEWKFECRTQPRKLDRRPAEPSQMHPSGSRALWQLLAKSAPNPLCPDNMAIAIRQPNATVALLPPSIIIAIQKVARVLRFQIRRQKLRQDT